MVKIDGRNRLSSRTLGWQLLNLQDLEDDYPAWGLYRRFLADAFAKQGAAASGGTPQDYAAFMREESSRWGEVVRRNNIKIE